MLVESGGRQARLGGVMHTVFFSLKRAFHKTMAFGRALLDRWGLTPSRFDMLYAVNQFCGNWSGGWMRRQSR